MPKTARRKIESGIYHVIIRGSNRQEIFHDQQNRLKSLEALERYKKETKIKIHALISIA
mgnify:CR=1 FL=1